MFFRSYIFCFNLKNDVWRQYLMFVDCTWCLWTVHDVCGLYLMFVDCTWCLWTVLDVCGLYLLFVDCTWCLLLLSLTCLVLQKDSNPRFRADASTTLQRIIDSNLEEYLPKFETVSEAASKEHVFERNLEKMKVRNCDNICIFEKTEASLEIETIIVLYQYRA